MRDYYKPNRKYVGQVTTDKHGTAFEHGLGFYDLPLTGKCAGEFDYNKVTGVGAKIWEHGETYVGQWMLNKKEGIGVHVWPTGARYYGQFKNNKPCGYGILETVHEGVKFVGRVDGMIAEPREGQWYLNGKPCGLEDANIDGLGCRVQEDGSIINAVGGRTTKYLEDGGHNQIGGQLKDTWVTRHEEKNIITETKHVAPFDFEQGKRDTTYYGDWMRTLKGHFLSGRPHGRALVHQLGAADFKSNWILGDPVDFDTYSSIAFESLPTRSIKRRMTRRYCAIYDLAVNHLKKTNEIYGMNEEFTIVEFGIGRGEHLQFLRKVFPQAKIIGVDSLTPDSEPQSELQEKQISDIKTASRLHDQFILELGVDCYSSDTCKTLLEKHGPIDLAIHDATHGPYVWNKLGAIKNCLHGQRGLLITEEMCCSIDEHDREGMDWEQIKKAKGQKWRMWDLRPLNYHKYKNSFIGVWTPIPHQFEANALGLYEIYDD